MKEFPRPSASSGGESPIPDENPPLASEKAQTNGISVSSLLAHHWRAVLDYASICTVSPESAKKLAGGAFLRTIGDLSPATPGSDVPGPASPWRIRLLTAVLQTAGEWGGDERRFTLQPGLRELHGDKAGSPSRPEHTNLVRRAFAALPERAQARLWHAEVEAEDIGTSAVIGSPNPAAARVELQRDRVLLRTACQQAHLNLGGDYCRRYNRLLDVYTSRPGVPMMADLQEHLDSCAFCRRAADQFDHSGDRLRRLLAGAVLEFGADAYLAARRAGPGTTGGAVPTGDPLPEHGRHRTPGSRANPVLRQVRQRPVLALVVAGNVVIAALAAGFFLFPADSPSAASPPPSAPPSATPAPGPSAAPSARFRNAATSLCLDARSPATSGATAVTAPCSTQPTQRWRFDASGLLRNAGTDDLCLAFHRTSFRLQLSPCSTLTGDEPASPFDLSPDGLLVPREEQGLAVVPVDRTAYTAVVLKPAVPPSSDATQQWRSDPLTP
ncbi:RICIN domain-containing protein [Streptomyces sp. NPDC058685]|uniref:RICIN domain-containing protein n=1 Tax=Streptomyces sp. NPDC058685 TaxID=3346598 RepID=UPI00365DD4D2